MSEEELVFNRTSHYSMWMWLAEHPDRDKGDWTGWEFDWIEALDYNLCFACKYDMAIDPERDNPCEHCPLIWGNEEECSSYMCEAGGAYRRYGRLKADIDYFYCDTSADRTIGIKIMEEKIHDACVQIANLPVKEGVKCI